MCGDDQIPHCCEGVFVTDRVPMEGCPDCTCKPVTYGSYFSLTLELESEHFCCDRSRTPEIGGGRRPVPDYSRSCPTMCVAKCGDNYHCCKGTPTVTKAPPASSVCIPSSARVSLENGKSVTMSDLQIGDKVQTGKGFSFEYMIRKYASCHHSS